jgi:hypothetical protein
MEVIVELHTPAVLAQNKDHALPVGYAGWSPEPVWTLWKRETFRLSGIEPRPSSPWPVSIQTALLASRYYKEAHLNILLIEGVLSSSQDVFKAGKQSYILILIIGVCILSRLYQLNIRTPPYTTNVSALVHNKTLTNICRVRRCSDI